MYAVAQGNPFDGIVITGPFGSYEEAVSHGEDGANKDWWVVELETP